MAKETLENEGLSNLYTEAGIQDSLLQSYRGFQLTMQSIFIAIGAGVTLFNISNTHNTEVLLGIAVFTSVAIISLFSLIKIRRVILSRGKDVDYWQNEIIKAEKQARYDKKYITRFKVYQKLHRKKIDDIEFKTIEVNDDILDQLTEKGKGHTRRVLDTQIFFGFVAVWITLFLIMLLKLILVNSA